MRTFGALALGGLAGLVVLKLVAALILPLFGVMFGLVGMLVKVGLWLAVAYFVYTLIRGRRKEAVEV